MQVAVNFQNEIIAQKVLWILGHFKNDSIEVINSFKNELNEIHLINQEELTSRPVQEFFNELKQIVRKECKK